MTPVTLTTQPAADIRYHRQDRTELQSVELIERFRGLPLGHALVATPAPATYAAEIHEAIEQLRERADWPPYRDGKRCCGWAVAQGVGRTCAQVAKNLRTLLQPIADEQGCNLAVRRTADGRVAAVKLHNSMPSNTPANLPETHS